MSNLLAGLPAGALARVAAGPPPERPGVMAATLTERRFSDPAWLFERKLDGERCLAWVTDGVVRLRSRNHLSLDGTYPELADALQTRARGDVVVDGEVVALDRAGNTSFALLQQRLGLRSAPEARASGVAVHYYLFDLLWADGHDLRELELSTRKALLRRAVAVGGPLRYSAHRRGSGEAFYAHACRRGWEGVIAKRAASPYVGRRSPDWLKMKCELSQELVIGGFTDPQRSRIGFGALLLGYHEAGRLRYAGKVGTGFDTAALRGLRVRLDELAQPDSPFADPVRERGAHWVRPELVAQVRATAWTADGKLRHPRFLGLRRDKKPADVVRERPA